MSGSVLPVFLQESYSVWSHIQVFHLFLAFFLSFSFFFLYNVKECSNFSFFMQLSSFPRTIYCKLYFHHRLVDHRCIYLHLGFLSYSIDVYFYFCDSTILLLITTALQYSPKLRILIPLAPFFFSVFVCLFGVFCVFIQILRLLLLLFWICEKCHW